MRYDQGDYWVMLTKDDGTVVWMYQTDNADAAIAEAKEIEVGGAYPDYTVRVMQDIYTSEFPDEEEEDTEISV